MARKTKTQQQAKTKAKAKGRLPVRPAAPQVANRRDAMIAENRRKVDPRPLSSVDPLELSLGGSTHPPARPGAARSAKISGRNR